MNNDTNPKDILPHIIAYLKSEGISVKLRDKNDPRTYLFTYQDEQYLLCMKSGSLRLTISKLVVINTILPAEIIYQICVETSAREPCAKSCVLYIQNTASEEKEYAIAFICQFFTTASLFQTFFIDYLTSLTETEKIFNAYYQRTKSLFSIRTQPIPFKETSLLQ